MRLLLFALLWAMLFIALVEIQRARNKDIEGSLDRVQTHIDPFEDHPMHCMCYFHR